MKRTGLLGSLALATLVLPLGAQRTQVWTTRVGAGITIPTGNAADAMKTGFNIAVAIGQHLTDSRLGWAVDASYHRTGNKLVDGGHDNIFVGLGRITYDVAPTVYLLAGAGILRNEFKDTRVTPSINNTRSAFALAGGVGVEFGSSLFAEARLLDGFTKGGSTVLMPITVGVRF
jgi:hypothetical protein